MLFVNCSCSFHLCTIVWEPQLCICLFFSYTVCRPLKLQQDSSACNFPYAPGQILAISVWIGTSTADSRLYLSHVYSSNYHLPSLPGCRRNLSKQMLTAVNRWVNLSGWQMLGVTVHWDACDSSPLIYSLVLITVYRMLLIYDSKELQ